MRESLSLRLRFDVLKRDRFTCQYCGAHPPDVKLRIDHVWPVARGGRTVLENLKTACFECNAGKRDFTLSEIEVPAEVPPDDGDIRDRIGYFVGFSLANFSDADADQAAFIAAVILGEYGAPLSAMVAMAKDATQWRDLVWALGCVGGMLEERVREAKRLQNKEEPFGPRTVEQLLLERLEQHLGRPPLPHEVSQGIESLAAWVETPECKAYLQSSKTVASAEEGGAL